MYSTTFSTFMPVKSSSAWQIVTAEQTNRKSASSELAKLEQEPLSLAHRDTLRRQFALLIRESPPLSVRMLTAEQVKTMCGRWNGASFVKCAQREDGAHPPVGISRERTQSWMSCCSSGVSLPSTASPWVKKQSIMMWPVSNLASCSPRRDSSLRKQCSDRCHCSVSACIGLQWQNVTYDHLRLRERGLYSSRRSRYSSLRRLSSQRLRSSAIFLSMRSWAAFFLSTFFNLLSSIDLRRFSISILACSTHQHFIQTPPHLQQNSNLHLQVIWSHPQFFYTQNLHLGHCLNFFPFTKAMNFSSSSLVVALILYSLQLMSLCHSTRQFKQYSFPHSKHSNRSGSSFSWKNMQPQLAVGHHDIVSPCYSAQAFRVCCWYFSISSPERMARKSLSRISAWQSSEGQRRGNVLLEMLLRNTSARQSLWKMCPQSNVSTSPSNKFTQQISQGGSSPSAGGFYWSNYDCILRANQMSSSSRCLRFCSQSSSPLKMSSSSIVPSFCMSLGGTK